MRQRTTFRIFFFFSSRRRHTRSLCDWSSDVCSSDLGAHKGIFVGVAKGHASNEETWSLRNDGERGQRLLRPRVLPGPQIVTARCCLVRLRLALSGLIKTSFVARRRAVTLIGDGAEGELSPG